MLTYEGKKTILQIFFGVTPPLSWRLRLFGNDLPETPTLIPPLFQEVSGGGYSPATLTPLNVIIGLDDFVFARFFYTFTFTSSPTPSTIYGWYLTDDANSKVIAVERLLTPVTIPSSGSNLDIDFHWRLP